MTEIDEQFCAQYDRIRQELVSKEPDLEGRLKILEELQTLHGMIVAFPVWPFNTESIARFGTSYVAPVLLAGLVALLERVF